VSEREAAAPEEGGKSGSRGLREAASAPTRRTVREGALACQIAYTLRDLRGLNGRKLPVKTACHSRLRPTARRLLRTRLRTIFEHRVFLRGGA